MQKSIKMIRLIAYLIRRKVRRLVRSIGLRNPSNRFIIARLSGDAIMVWTSNGNIVIPTSKAREIARKLEFLADMETL